MKDPDLLLQHSPFLNQQMTTQRVMVDVLLALTPAVLMGIWYFGIAALLIIIVTILGAVMTEWVFAPQTNRTAHLRDGSTVVTGLLLGMTLPPALPLWMAFLGGVIAIGLGKIIWGGLGQNMFNPALVGRAFLLATFPAAMTTWSLPSGEFWQLPAGLLSLPLTYQPIDAITAATPLGQMKFEQLATPLSDLLFGHTSGSIGETSGLLLLLGGLFLWYRRDLDWRIPVSIMLSAALFSGLLNMIVSDGYPTPLFTLFSGGLMLGTFYMATDPVTSPTTPMGTWIFGLSIGFLVVLIRVFGGLPEGVMYAILLMNAATPLIDRVTQPRVFGHGRSSP